MDVSAFNILSRFVIALLTRSKRLLISWLQSPSGVILEPKEIKPGAGTSYSSRLSRCSWCQVRQMCQK